MTHPNEIHTPPAAPIRPRRVLIVVLVVIAVAVLGGASALAFTLGSKSTGTPAVSVAPGAAAPSRSPDPIADPLRSDPIAQQVCPMLIPVGVNFSDPDEMERIGELARTSADTTLRHAGGLLAGSAQLARAAKGKSKEVQYSLDLQKSGLDLAGLCKRAGY